MPARGVPFVLPGSNRGKRGSCVWRVFRVGCSLSCFFDGEVWTDFRAEVRIKLNRPLTGPDQELTREAVGMLLLVVRAVVWNVYDRLGLPGVCVAIVL